MSTDTETALDRLRPAAVPGRIGQATAVEQSRAIAEVQAQVIVAQQMPRNIDRANRDMLRSCAMKSLAEKAFYRYSRGGSQISGPSVQLARELARCWGNVQYGITELRRDDDHGQSEMLAFAWDLETNTRSSTTFIVQHVRDVGKTSKPLTEQRDIYENNANNGARRLREMVFAILPGWYTEDAVGACYATLAADESDGATAAERAANAVTRFGKLGVTAEQLAQKLGAPQARWTPSDLAQLAVIWKSIERRETTPEAEFGATPPRVTAADIIAQAAPKDASPAQAVTTPAPATPPTPRGAGEAPERPTPAAHADAAASTGAPASTQDALPGDRPAALIATGQKSQLNKRRQELGYTDSEEDWQEWLTAVARLARLPEFAELATVDQLTQDEAKTVQDELKRVRDRKALQALVRDGVVPDGQ